MTIAVLSAACRLPGSDTPAAFFDALLAGHDAVGEVPADRWDHAAWVSADGRPGTTRSRWGAFLADPWGFDAAAFGLRPADAEAMDPQQRLLLACAREALAAAGVGDVAGRRVGVFVGATYATHGERVAARFAAGLPIPGSAIIGNLDNMLAARLSHALDLRGPALAVDTACSSTLVALHLARRSLEAGECELALVGGAHLLMTPTLHLMMGRAGALSSTGRCRPFAADADGIVLGEGVGVFVLAPEAAARAAGWSVAARLVGSAVNNDGQSLNPMAPRPGGQAEVMAAAWQAAGLDPHTVGYIEAHGTGTPVGDPVEAASLIRVFGGGSDAWVGAVKGNVGHLLGAAGVPALLKVLGMLERGVVPPTLHGPEAAGLAGAGLRVPVAPAPWSGHRRAAINAFGFGGTNAHVILEAVADAVRPAAIAARPGPALRLAVPATTGDHLPAHPLLRRRLAQRLGLFAYAADVAPTDALLAQHAVAGQALLPGAVLWDAMRAALADATGAPGALADVRLRRPATAGALRVEVRAEPLRVQVVDDAGVLAEARGARAGEAPPRADLEALRAAHPEPADGQALLARLRAAGMVHGPLYQRVEALWRGPGGALARLSPSPAGEGPVLDAAMQPIGDVLAAQGATALRVPASVERLDAWGGAPRWAVVRGVGVEGDVARADVDVLTEAGEFCWQISGLRLLPVRLAPEAGWFHRVEWAAAEAREMGAGRVVEVAPDATPSAAVEQVHAALAAPGPVCVITRGAWAIDPGDEPRPAHAAAAAYAAAAGSERGDWGALDLAPGDAVPTALPLGRGWPCAGPAAGAAAGADPRPDVAALAAGTWLLIGGAAGITFEIARALAGPARRLVIAGRAPLDAARSARLAALRALGSVVEYHAGDAREAAALVALAGPGLVGVVHGAGEVHPGRYLARTPAERAATLGGKLDGARALAAALDAAGVAPRVLLLSSLSGALPEVLGGGLADYAAANAGLDALAAGRPGWVSLGYGPWAEVGMGPAAAASSAALGFGALPTGPAVQAALRAVSGAGHMVVAPIVAPPVADAPAVQAAESTTENVEDVLVELVARALDLAPEDVAVDASLAGLGLDSLAAVDVARALEGRGFGRVSASLFFEQRTIAGLARALRPAAAPPAPADPEPPTAPANPEGPTAAAQVGAPTALEQAFLTQQALFPAVVPFAYVRQTVRGPLDPARLAAALGRLVAHHRALRTHFVAGRRVVEAAATLPVLRYRVADDAALRRLEDALANGPFGAAPLARVALVRQGDRTHLALATHHGVVDGWGAFLLVQRLWDLYADLDAPLPADGAGEPGPTLPGRARPWPALPGRRPGPPDGPRRAWRTGLDAAATARLHARAAALDVTPFALLAAAWAQALGQWADLDALTLSIAVGGRDAGTADVVGCLADTVALDVAGTADLTRCALGIAAAWPDVARGPAGRPAGPAPDGGPAVASPFGLSVATFRGQPPADVELLDVVARTATAATRLGLTVWLAGGRLGAALNAPAQAFEPAAIAALVGHLDAALAAASTLEVVEKTQENDALLGPFWRACAAWPAAVAVDDGRQRRTYAALADQVRGWAAGLQARGVGPGDVVAVDVDADPVVPLLAVLTLGAVWLPLDPDQPAPRTDAQLSVAAPALRVRASERLAGPAVVLGPLDPERGACVFFTSGSSGRPKGVPVTAAALAGYLAWADGMLGLAPGERLLQTSAPTFDASLRQLLGPLRVGASVHTTTGAERRDPAGLRGRLARVTHLNTSPALLARLVEAPGPAPAALRHVTVGGEALSAALVRQARAAWGAELVIWNLYGPTEATINATAWRVEDDDPVPIGAPLPGMEAWLLDAEGEPAAEGELCVAGPAVFAGYLGDVAAPWVETPSGSMAYRTGDRARRREDGALLFLGRLDDQVQVRGVRVEPGEIEAVLQACPGVTLAAVRREGEGADAWLAAWVEGSVEAEAARAFAAAHLPAVMVPRWVQVVPRLPLGPTGKVDRGALQVAAAPDRVPRGRPPETPTERRVAEAWAAALGVEALGADDDFFALGGDSMAAVAVSARLGAPRAALIYAHPTLGAYAAALAAARPTAPAGADESALSPAQIGFLLAEQADPARPAVWRARLVLDGPLDADALAAAWAFVYDRHPLLRATFTLGGARIGPPGAPALPHQRVARLADEPVPAPALVPATGPLIAARLVTDAAGAQALDVAAHHLIGDAHSLGVLVEELLAAHDAFAAGQAPPAWPPPAPFAAIAEAQRQRAATADERAFWGAVFAAPYAAPDLPPGPLQSVDRAAGAADAGAVLDALHGALADAVGQDDLVVGVAHAGRDLPIPGVERVVGPVAQIIPVRVSSRGGGAAALQRALAHALPPGALRACLPTDALPGGQIVLSALPAATATAARVRVADADTQMALPAGTALQVVARTTPAGLRLRFTAATTALALEALADAVAGRLAEPPLDAALIASLPADLPPAWRASLGGAPRWLGTADTPLGQLGLCCLPTTSAEPVDAWAVAAAVDAGRPRARAGVALAGTLPARTAYGHDVAAHLADAAALTTGHAATAVAVAWTVLACCERLGRPWGAQVVAVLGVGSVGRAVAALLGRHAGPPRRWVLCDVPARAASSRAFAAELAGIIDVVDAEPAPPGAVYGADVIIGASSGAATLAVDALRPGTVVVDDSFPHCFDVAAAWARMAEAEDVLLVGGGLLDLPGTRRAGAGLGLEALRLLPAQGLPGCAVGALLHAGPLAGTPDLGLVTAARADAAWAALSLAGARVPALHLGARDIPPALIAALAGRLSPPPTSAGPPGGRASPGTSPHPRR
ncbi:MAG: AMP-binding protein [Myxococcales bacterium]|nr:AMP-binding protein [Myxococcales bacterium]